MRSRQAADDSTRPILLISSRQQEFLLDGYRELIAVDGGIEAHLAAVLGDAVAHPGSFVRAQTAFDVARRHGVGRDRARALAVAVEYFHTASLIFDDLPMMDDARQRRGRPCPHRVHGEAAAVLGALSLIDRAYALVWEVLAEIPAARSRRAGELITTCLGARGVLGGQSRDLHPGPGALSEEEILAVALGKTVPLIRLTLLLPALAGGASDADLEGLDRLSHCWGPTTSCPRRGGGPMAACREGRRRSVEEELAGGTSLGAQTAVKVPARCWVAEGPGVHLGMVPSEHSTGSRRR